MIELHQHEIFSQLTIAIYSTSISEEDVDKALANGANVHIQKPYEFKQLKNMLSEVVMNSQSIVNNFSRDNFVVRM